MSETVEYGIRTVDGETWAVPDWAVTRCAQLGKSPLTWARTVAEAEGGTVVARFITVSPWAPADDPDREA